MTRPKGSLIGSSFEKPPDPGTPVVTLTVALLGAFTIGEATAGAVAPIIAAVVNAAIAGARANVGQPPSRKRGTDGFRG